MKYDVYQGLFIWPQKKTLNLHLTYFVETLYPASPQTNKKALIPLRIRAFPNFAFLRSGAYERDGKTYRRFTYNGEGDA